MDFISNSVIENQRTHDRKNICVIGAGPSGLGALQIILDSPQYKAGMWKPVSFEARSDLGGVWLPAPPTDDPPVTPMYDSLTTNLPHPVMAYGSFPFPPGTLLYPPASTVLTYLRDYASHFDLNQYIRFNITVKEVDWDDERKQWKVLTLPTHPTGDSSSEEHWFDLIVVANGHYRVPNYPDTPGVRTWLEAGKASHSAWYRHAHNVGNVILVVGGGPSGIDVADEMREVSKVVIHSVPGTTRADIDGGSFKKRGRIVEFADPVEGRVLFEDGTSETGIDHCILATGYEHSLPFLPAHLLRCDLPPSIPPLPDTLYNSRFHVFPLAKHLFPLTTSLPSSRVAFLVLPYKVVPFPLIEAQMRVVLKVFADPECLDRTLEAIDIVSRYEELRKELGDSERAIARAWHKMDEESQFDYRDELHRFVGGEYAKDEWKVPTWVRDIYKHKVILRGEWKELVRAAEAGKWVEGVGSAPGEESTKQWVDLMWRLIERARNRQAIPDSNKYRL